MKIPRLSSGTLIWWVASGEGWGICRGQKSGTPVRNLGPTLTSVALRQAGTWGLLLQCLHLDKCFLLEQQNTKKPEGMKGFPDGSAVKNLPAMQETRVQSLGQEDPLEKEMATTSVFLPGKSYGMDGLQSIELQRVRHD